MPKSSGAFTGIKLTEQTPPTGAGLDQRLFSPSTPQKVSQPMHTRETKKEVGKEGSRETGKETSLPAKREEGEVFDINEKPYRKDSFLFSTREFEALEDLKLELRRKFDLRATKNDLARCALQHLIEDYKRHKDGSLLVRRLKNKVAR